MSSAAAAPAPPSFVAHLHRVSGDRALVLDFRRNFHIVRHKHNRRRFRKGAVKQALEHLICYLGTVPAEWFPSPQNFDSDSDTDADFEQDESALSDDGGDEAYGDGAQPIDLDSAIWRLTR